MKAKPQSFLNSSDELLLLLQACSPRVPAPIALFGILLDHQLEKRQGRGRHFPSSVSLQAARCPGLTQPCRGLLVTDTAPTAYLAACLVPFSGL